MPENVPERDGVFVIRGRCGHCNHEISIHLETSLTHERQRGLDADRRALIDSFLGKKSDYDIAAECQVSYAFVSARRRELNLPPYNVLDDTEHWKAIDPLYTQHTDAELARMTGIKYAQIRARRLRLDVAEPQLSERINLRKKIMVLYDQGFTMADIGRAVRLTRQRIEQIVKEENARRESEQRPDSPVIEPQQKTDN